MNNLRNSEKELVNRIICEIKDFGKVAEPFIPRHKFPENLFRTFIFKLFENLESIIMYNSKYVFSIPYTLSLVSTSDSL